MGRGAQIYVGSCRKKKCSVSFNKMAPLVRKQAFFLKCPAHPPFPIESRHSLHFSFPRHSLVVSLYQECPPLKSSYNTFPSWMEISLEFIYSFYTCVIRKYTNQGNKQKQSSNNKNKKKKNVSLFNLHTILSISMKKMRKWTDQRRLGALDNAFH